ncbi:hypothetical protein NBCG_03498 [Nocardioidaceae bacterium Broad-1]|nr:hypothetical protein NBCG_03498 [Nocardioidaceae bacterium Broad-1]
MRTFTVAFSRLVRARAVTWKVTLGRSLRIQMSPELCATVPSVVETTRRIDLVERQASRATALVAFPLTIVVGLTVRLLSGGLAQYAYLRVRAVETVRPLYVALTEPRVVIAVSRVLTVKDRVRCPLRTYTDDGTTIPDVALTATSFRVRGTHESVTVAVVDWPAVTVLRATVIFESCGLLQAASAGEAVVPTGRRTAAVRAIRSSRRRNTTYFPFGAAGCGQAKES